MDSAWGYGMCGVVVVLEVSYIVSPCKAGIRYQQQYTAIAYRHRIKHVNVLTRCCIVPYSDRPHPV
jgi:hypothetical protein